MPGLICGTVGSLNSNEGVSSSSGSVVVENSNMDVVVADCCITGEHDDSKPTDATAKKADRAQNRVRFRLVLFPTIRL